MDELRRRSSSRNRAAVTVVWSAIVVLCVASPTHVPKPSSGMEWPLLRVTVGPPAGNDEADMGQPLKRSGSSDNQPCGKEQKQSV